MTVLWFLAGGVILSVVAGLSFMLGAYAGAAANQKRSEKIGREALRNYQLVPRDDGHHTQQVH